MIANLLAERSPNYKSSYSFILNQELRVIIHHEEKYLNRLFPEEVETAVVFDKEAGEFVYTLDGEAKQACYSRIPQTGWIVITAFEKREVLLPILLKIALTIIFPSCIALFLSIWQSRRLSRRFSEPLYRLQEEIAAAIDGTGDGQSTYSYPDNEIGSIAEQIQQLAERELYKRAQKLEQTNTELHKTVESLRTLQGIIPICSSCKRIRDDEGSWNQLESYFKKHSDTQFSHGMCPTCMEKFYSGEDWYQQ